MFKIGEAYISLGNEVTAVTFNSPTSVSIWWRHTLIGHYTGTEDEVNAIRAAMECMTEETQKHMDNLRTKGPYYQEEEKFEAMWQWEDRREDRRAQRKAQREQKEGS